MATAERERPPVIVSGDRETSRQRLLGEAWSANAARALWAAGLMFLIGSLADLVLLLVVGGDWGNPYWEFTAMAATLEGTPRIVLAIALIWVALYIRGTPSLLWYRVLAVLLICLGVSGAAFGAITVSDFFILRGEWDPANMKTGASVLLKTLTLSGLHVFLLVPIGVMGVRRPRV